MKRIIDNALMRDLSKTAADSFSENLKMIDINDIEPNSDNFYELSDIELLAEDIAQRGLKHNLVVAPTDNGKYIIISGHRRYEAVKRLWEEKRITSHYLPCYINPIKSEDENIQELIMLNATSRIISDGESLKQFQILKRIFDNQKEMGVKTGRIREKIAAQLGVSNGQVAKMENIEKNAIPEVKEAIESGNVSISTASEIAKLDTSEQKALVEKKDISSIKPKDIKPKQQLEEKVVTNDNFYEADDEDETDDEYFDDTDDNGDENEDEDEDVKYSGTNDYLFNALSNDQKRRSFTQNYKDWGVWFTSPDLFFTYYKYDLPDGSRIIVLEHLSKNYYPKKEDRL